MNTLRYILCLVSLFCLINLSMQSNILAIFPTCSPSHGILGRELLKGLAVRGHEVTMFSVYPLKTPVENYTDITPKTDLCEVFHSNMPKNFFKEKMSVTLSKIIDFLKMDMMLTESTITDENMQTILNSTKNYDAVIVQAFFAEGLFPIAHHLGVPLIVFSTFGTLLSIDDLLGNPKPYAYVPDLLLGYSSKMTFMQRVTNTITSTGIDLLKTIVHYPAHERIRAKHFPNSPDLFTIIKSTSLVLVSSHVSISYPRPLLPNFVEISGFAVLDPKPLPSDLQQYLDSAKDGAIYFSLGSNVQCSDMPEKMRNDIIRAFSRLKQKVLWKWEEGDLLNKPKNVKIGKWFPQTDILAHPNIKLFITHGGWGSLTEAIQRGVPIVGIPVFGEQHANLNTVINRGIGIRLDLDNVTYESFSGAINEVLNNNSYAVNMKEVSRLFNDRELKPMDRAAYWIEYVIRHKGAPHLRSAALELNQAQILLLDVILFLSAIVFIVGLIIVLCFKFTYRKCCGQRMTMLESNKKYN